MHLRQWAHARRFERLPGVGKLGNSLLGNDPILGMECGFHTRLRQALPERVSDIDRIRRICGERDYRQTDEQEAANEVEPTYVQAFIEVRIHVLNGTLEDEFRYWHQGFRPVLRRSQVALSA